MPNAGEVDVFATADVELATDPSELAKGRPVLYKCPATASGTWTVFSVPGASKSMPVKDECSDRRLVKVVTRQKQAPLYTGRAQGARRDTDSNARRVERVTSVAVSQFAASDPSVTMLVNNPVYDAHEMYEDMVDPDYVAHGADGRNPHRRRRCCNRDTEQLAQQ